MNKPENESERLAFIQSLQIVETPIEERFERITRLVSRVFSAPICGISIVDGNREWFKSIFGSDVVEVPRAEAFGALTILRDGVHVIEDVTKEYVPAGNPLVFSDSPVHFYAGVPITIAKDVNIGVLSIYDFHPREFGSEDELALADFCASATTEIKARLVQNIYDTRN